MRGVVGAVAYGAVVAVVWSLMGLAIPAYTVVILAGTGYAVGWLNRGRES